MKKNFIKKLFFLIALNLTFLQIYANEDSFFKPKTEEEALFLRRIAEFWQDGEIEITKFQIETYISNHPKGSLTDSLYALLGNIFMNEKDYSKAVSSFDNIKTEEIKDKIAINLLASLYHLKWYQRLIDECDIYAKKVDGELKQKIIYIQALSFYNKSLETTDKSENNQYVEKAKNKFEELLDSQFGNQAREYLSQIHKALNEYEKASEYFVQLAEKDITKEDEYLFQAALLQAHFDKEKALNTFNRITQCSSIKSKEASFNKLVLLFEMQRFEDIIKEKDIFLQKIAEEKLSIANFFIGKSFFKNNDYENAIIYLQNALNSEEKTSDQMRIAHILLMQSSFALNNLDLYEKTFNSFLTLFPLDEQLFECYFAKAILNKNNLKYDNAKNDFEKISQTYIQSKENDKFMYEYAHLLFLLEDIQNSKSQFKQFIEKYPHNELLKSSLICIVNCSIKELQKQLSQEELISTKKLLVSEIENLLHKEILLTKKEKSQYTFLLAKTHFDLSNYELCLNLSQNLLKDNLQEISDNNDPTLSKEDLSEINLLIGFCYKNTNEDLHQFIHFAQKSLELSQNPKNHFLTFVNLYNSYLALSKEKDIINENHLDKAANYLFDAFEISPNEINKTNLIWLSNHYLAKVKLYLNANYKNKIQDANLIFTYCKNATSILTHMLNNPEDYLEEFTINASYLLNVQSKYKEEESLLENVVQTYRFHPEKQNKYLEEIIYALAKNYEAQNMNDKAIALYLEFLPSYKPQSPFKASATLHLSRLQLSMIAKENFLPTNKDLEKIITTLKTLSVQRNLENEPVHLEAALDYVDIVCYMERNDNWGKKLFLLGRLKENFCAEEDVISKDYQTMRKILKDKDKIFNTYMTLVEAEKNICLGYLEKNENQLHLAKEILIKMSEEGLIVNEYLENRVRMNMKTIEDFKLEEK